MPLEFSSVRNPDGTMARSLIFKTRDRRVAGKDQWQLHRMRDGDLRLTAVTLGLVYVTTVGDYDWYTRL